MPEICYESTLWNDLRFRSMPASFKAALWGVITRLDGRGDGAYTDKQLRIDLLGPKRWDQFTSEVMNWGWLRRNEKGNLVRAGMLNPAANRLRDQRSGQSPSELSNSSEPSDLSDLQRQIDDLTNLVRQALAGMPVNAARSGHESSTNHAQNGHESRTGESEPSAQEPPINQLIDSSKHSLGNSINSIQLIEDPVAHQRAYLDTMLIEIGIDRDDVLKAFDKRDLAYIAAGVECVKLGHWSKSKTKYDPKVSLCNYLLRDLKLPWSYQNLADRRTQTALDILVPTGTPEARASPAPAAHPPAAADTPANKRAGVAAAPMPASVRDLAGFPRKAADG